MPLPTRPRTPWPEPPPFPVPPPGGDSLQTALMTFVISAVLVAMNFNGTFALLLPVLAIALVLFSRGWDDHGLIFCALIILSFSYYYSLGQVVGLLTVMRVVLLALLLIAAVKSLARRLEYGAAAAAFLLFFLLSAASSVLFSMYPQISLLKVGFAGFFLLGVMLAAGGTGRFPYALLGAVIAVAVLSAALFFINPAVGYAYSQDPNAAFTASGRYSGVMNHPQLLACLLAVNIPVLLFMYVSQRGLPSALSLLGLVCAFFINAISSSRTAMLATLVAVGLSVFLYARAAVDQESARKTKTVFGLCILLLLAGGIAFSEQIATFVRKTEDVGAGISLSGREEIIFASWNGFLDRPLLGHGFQVPSPFTEHGASTFGLTSEATSVEKCFFLTMLLEEAGLLGTAVFFLGILLLYRHWLRKGAVVSVAAMTAFLMVNVGEACILSPSSLGGLCWLSVFAAHNLTFRDPPPDHGPR